MGIVGHVHRRLALLVIPIVFLSLPSAQQHNYDHDHDHDHGFLESFFRSIAQHEPQALKTIEARPRACALTHNGVNALHVATRNGNEAAVRAILHAGVDPLVKDGRGTQGKV